MQRKTDCRVTRGAFVSKALSRETQSPSPKSGGMGWDGGEAEVHLQAVEKEFKLVTFPQFPFQSTNQNSPVTRKSE